LLQVDPREGFRCPYVYKPNISMSVNTSQQPPPSSLYTHQLIVPPQTSPAHLYQLSYFPNQTIPQNSAPPPPTPPPPPPPPPSAQQANALVYYPSVPASNLYSQYYSPYIQVIIKYKDF